MTAAGWAQIAAFFVAVLAVTKPLGIYMARVFERQRTFLDPMARPVERALYRLTGVDETHDMRWTEYGAALLVFSLVSIAALYALLRLQAWLLWNPQAIPAMAPGLAFNTAVSFTTY
ncbi:MAG: potassium-transporting ATPase subunit KdpA, partial [Acidobacteria bacterium]|nr:potassium-transporting ATPase subunit KdpA [Acidobacteriota bacterium]